MYIYIYILYVSKAQSLNIFQRRSAIDKEEKI